MIGFIDKSVAYQAVSVTLQELCSSGFVHWRPLGYFLGKEYSSNTKTQTSRVVRLTTTALWEVILVNLHT